MFTIMDSCLDIDGFVRRLEALEKGLPIEKESPAPRTTETLQKPTPRPAAAKHMPQSFKQEPSVSSAKRFAPAAAPAAARLPEDIISAEAEDEPEEEAEQAVIEPIAVKPDGLTDRQIWDKMLKQFAKSPFVYDIMTNCSVTFGQDQWILCFGPGKEFYQIPAQNKLPEMEQAALKISGRVIKIKLEGSSDGGQRREDTKKDSLGAAESVKQTPAGKPLQTAAVAAEKTAKAVLSDEEPFIKADFEADVVASKEETPEEVKNILEIFSGELLA